MSTPRTTPARAPTSLAHPTEGATTARARGVEEAPVGRTTGWWGMLLFICTEAAMFAAFIASYFYIRFSTTGGWPPPHEKLPHLLAPGIGTGILVASCLPMALSVLLARDHKRLALPMSMLTFLCGVAFVLLQIVDYKQEYPSSYVSKDAYSSLLYTITGLHVVHVVLGLLMLLLLIAGTMARGAGRAQAGSLRVVAMYWYFLALLAVAIYITVYISPYL